MIRMGRYDFVKMRESSFVFNPLMPDGNKKVTLT